MRVPDVADVQTRPAHRVKMVGTAGARVRRRWASWRRRPGSLTLCDGLRSGPEIPSTVRGARGLERTRDYAGPTSILPEPTADRLRPSRVSICARGAPRAERPRGRAFRRGGGSGDRRCEACVGSHGLLAVRDRSWEHRCGWEWPWHLAYPSTRRAALPPIRSFLAGRAIKICDLTDAASDPKVDVMS